ncbi:MAG: FAD-binding oxidoreductase [Candidatus Nanopelagicales bacterium]
MGLGVTGTRAETRADAIVVGGGIAGAAAAYFLARAGASVVLLEREPVLAHHTTGRSAALYLQNHGAPPVRRLTLASRAFLESPPTGLVEAALLSPRPSLEVGGPELIEVVRNHARSAVELVPSSRLLDPIEAVAMCPVLRPEALGAAVLEPDSADIDVMALHAGFIRGLRRAGGQVHTSAGVVALDRSAQGWRARTAQEALEAPVLVNAGGAWAAELAGLAGVAPVGLQPLHRTAFLATLPEGVDARGWPLVEDLGERWYFKPEGDGLLCSPADAALVPPGDARARDEDVALAIEWINAVTTLGLRHVRSAWAGLRTFAPDRIPVVGLDPDAPGFVWLAGLGGFGIMTAPALGVLAAGEALGLPLDPGLAAVGVDPDDYRIGRLR